MSAVLPFVTPESVRDARLYCLRERAKVTELVGVRFAPDGTFYLPHLDLGVLLGNAIWHAVNHCEATHGYK